MEKMEIRLEKIVHGGDAMGFAPDGRPVFLPFGAPGERVRVEVREEHKGFLRARLLETIEPSPDRVTPRCRHFGECGGCQFQHLEYPFQLAVKETILREQFLRLGGILDVPIRPVIPSPSPWNYRNSVQFTPTSGRRLGFYRADSHTVMPVEECHLPESRLVDLWKSLDWEPFPGLQQIGFRAGDREEMVVFESGTGEPPETTVESPVSVALLGPQGEGSYLAGGSLQYEISGRNFAVSAGSFFQVNTAQIPAMVNLVMEMAEPREDETAMDVYCGAGLFSAFLAGCSARLIGIEESPSAVRDFELNLDAFDSVELYAGPAEQALEEIPVRPSLAVVDPPRSGMTPRAMRALIRMAPARIVMVSCEMSTLARDSRVLAEAGYKLEKVAPIDMFPQTSHLETVSRWRKE
ncbi:MAG: class I SAM-dependent RNA methyltransferase [Anaerolineales bacterium]